MIRLENISKVYRQGEREVRALDQVNLAVAAGEFVAVRGSSGCGKSTLLLTVGGMIRPSEGKVFLNEQDLYALSSRQRAGLRATHIGFVFQMFHLVPYLNILENVLAPALAGPRMAPPQATALLERLHLSERLSHRPAELSTGERQRVALARALLNNPSIILADEPTGNLDPENATQVMNCLAEFHAHGGTVLLVTHEALADPYAQRTVFLARGGMEGDGGT